jgi:hypothetical protein
MTVRFWAGASTEVCVYQPVLRVSSEVTRGSKSAITATMTSEQIQRLKWSVDRRLETNLGADVRVQAAAFRPVNHLGELGPRWISIKELILPDNMEVGALPVLFEGKLESFVREAAVVTVMLRTAMLQVTGKQRRAVPGSASSRFARSRRGLAGLPVCCRKAARRSRQLLERSWLRADSIHVSVRRPR